MAYLLRAVAVGSLLLGGAAACVDLDVMNPNEPSRTQVLRTANDMESLVAGAWTNWWRAGNSVTEGPAMLLSVASFAHSSNAANFGMLTYGAIPRVPVQNDPTHPDWPNVTQSWFLTYRSLAAVADALREVEGDVALQESLGAARLARLRAHGRFLQGLGHASIAVLHDQGFVADESRAAIVDGQPVAFDPIGYRELMEAAIDYWQEAIDLAEAGGFDAVPATWIGRATTSAQLARLTYSLRAEYRAALARTPDERRDVSQGGLVDWRAVLADLERGIGFGETWGLDHVTLRQNQIIVAFDRFVLYTGDAGWQNMSYMVSGMADQSGVYQQWLAQPVGARHPNNAAHGPFLIRTPDLRFPQGSTVAEQGANPGRHWQIPDPRWYGQVNPELQWGQAARGTWRWSYYHRQEPMLWDDGDADQPWVDGNRLRLLAAEAHHRLGNAALAAELLNHTRVGQGGLDPTDAGGTNSSCVPRLPSGECGGLFEMLKWEQRENSWGRGPYSAAWYFDGRGWGDLYHGTPIDFPIPYTEAVVVGTATYTRGGVGRPGGAAPSVYSWPFEQ
jgi:hypothetical protein